MIGITGISGLVGTHLKKDFISQGIEFKSVDRSTWDLEEWKTDLELDEIFDQCHTVIHLGASTSSNEEDIRQISNSNLRSCINLFNWANKKNIHIIYISGAVVYEDVYQETILENSLQTVKNFGGFYGFTKKIGEDILMHYKANGLKSTILRPSSIYGLGLSKDKMIMNFINNALDKKEINISNPHHRINLVNALDVARGIRLACINQIEGNFNITGFDNSIIEIAEAIYKCINDDHIKINIESDDKKKDLRFNLNGNLAKSEFGYEPEINIEKGISIILDEMRNYKG